jgi:hypothetical protein
MSDKELVERLLDFDKVTVGDARDAALRIEQLVAINEALTKERGEAMQLLQTLSNMNGDLSRDMYKTKLLLAQAVEGQKIKALEQILEERGAVFDAMVDAAEDAAGKDVSFNVVVGRALRAAIAEIKGESHE